jgi:hypothetical protein
MLFIWIKLAHHVKKQLDTPLGRKNRKRSVKIFTLFDYGNNLQVLLGSAINLKI